MAISFAWNWSSRRDFKSRVTIRSESLVVLVVLLDHFSAVRKNWLQIEALWDRFSRGENLRLYGSIFLMRSM